MQYMTYKGCFKGLIYISVFIITLMFTPFAFACHDRTEPPGSEIICPAEDRTASQDLKENGLGIADMAVIDEVACKAIDDETGKIIYGWCEYRKADNNPLIYIVIYTDKTREEIEMILIFNPETKETIVFYDAEKKRDI